MTHSSEIVHMDCKLTSTKVGVFNALWRFLAVARQRRDLGRLDDAALADLGLSRADVSAELTRPIWDVPDQWRR